MTLTLHDIFVENKQDKMSSTSISVQEYQDRIRVRDDTSLSKKFRIDMRLRQGDQMVSPFCYSIPKGCVRVTDWVSVDAVNDEDARYVAILAPKQTDHHNPDGLYKYLDMVSSSLQASVQKTNNVA